MGNLNKVLLIPYYCWGNSYNSAKVKLLMYNITVPHQLKESISNCCWGAKPGRSGGTVCLSTYIDFMVILSILSDSGNLVTFQRLLTDTFFQQIFEYLQASHGSEFTSA